MRTLLLLGACGLAACTADASEVEPPDGTLFYPTGMAVAPDETVAFVANANSELRYNSGSLLVLKLDEVDRVATAWSTTRQVPDGCEQDTDHLETLKCDEPSFFQPDAGVRIGNFATDLTIQDLGGGNLRVITPTRGDPSVTWADWNGSDLACGGDESIPLCEKDHVLAYVQGDSDLASLPEEPFNVYADSAGQFAMVTHLTTGAVTLIDSPRDGNAQITDVLTGIFAADSNGLRGSTGVVGSPAGDGVVYVASRTEDRIQTFTVGRPVNGAAPFLLPGNWFFLDAVGGFAGGSNDTRGMTFSPDGTHLYLVNRRPATLQIIDTSPGPTGAPRNEAVGATDICRQGSTVTVSGTGIDERAYVTCFQDGQVYVVDPNAGTYVEDVILVGRGPYAVAAARTRNKLYVTNFLEDTIAVIDIAPSSPTRNRVVLRIGIPRSEEDKP